MKNKIFLYILSAVLFSAGCNVIDPVEKVPTYIHIDSFSVQQIDPVKEGSTSSNIKLAWVYFEGEAVGVFDLPADIPVLAGRAGRMTIAPGVVIGGLSSKQIIYPYYLGDTFNINPAPGEVINHVGKTRYVPDAKFLFKEDFETGNTFSKYYPGITTDTTIIRFADDPRIIEGKASGLITLSESTPTAESVSKNSFVLSNTSNAFLEIDYKCNVPFEVGVQGTLPDGTALTYYPAGMKPLETRNKFYVDLQPAVGALQARVYKVVVRAKLEDGQTNGYVIIDNIKVLSL